jgi:hypothetical protein
MEVVGAMMARLRCLNQQITALEQQLTGRFAAHPDAAIVQSLPRARGGAWGAGAGRVRR